MKKMKKMNCLSLIKDRDAVGVLDYVNNFECTLAVDEKRNLLYCWMCRKRYKTGNCV